MPPPGDAWLAAQVARSDLYWQAMERRVPGVTARHGPARATQAAADPAPTPDPALVAIRDALRERADLQPSLTSEGSAVPAAAALRALWRDTEAALLQAEIRELRAREHEPVRYLLVSDALHVDRSVRTAAKAAAARAATLLGVPPPVVRWFVEATLENQAAAKTWALDAHNTFWGIEGLSGQWASDRPGTIALRVTDDPRAAVRTAGHEMRHAWQAAALGPVGDPANRQAREQDATAFAQRVLAWHDAQTTDGEE